MMTGRCDPLPLLENIYVVVPMCMFHELIHDLRCPINRMSGHPVLKSLRLVAMSPKVFVRAGCIVATSLVDVNMVRCHMMINLVILTLSPSSSLPRKKCETPVHHSILLFLTYIYLQSLSLFEETPRPLSNRLRIEDLMLWCYNTFNRNQAGMETRFAERPVETLDHVAL